LSSAMSSQGISFNMQIFKSDSTSYIKEPQGNEINIGEATSQVKPVVEIFNRYSYFSVVWCNDQIYGSIFNSQNEKFNDLLIDTQNATNVSIAATSDDIYYVIVWANSYTNNIYAQYFLSNYPLSDILKLNTMKGENPKVQCFKTTGYCVVVWNSIVDKNIYAQYLNNNHTPIYATELQINNATENDQYYPTLSLVSTDGGVIFAWISNNVVNNQEVISVVARWFISDNFGLYPCQNDFILYNFTNFFECHPAIAAVSPGNFVIVWHDLGIDSSGYGIA